MSLVCIPVYTIIIIFGDVVEIACENMILVKVVVKFKDISRKHTHTHTHDIYYYTGPHETTTIQWVWTSLEHMQSICYCVVHNWFVVQLTGVTNLPCITN